MHVHACPYRSTVLPLISMSGNGLAENNANNIVMCPSKHNSGSNCIHKQVVHGTVLNQKLKWK